MQAMPVTAVMPKAPCNAAQAAGSGNEGTAAEGVDFSAMLMAQINGGPTLDADAATLLEAEVVETTAADVAVMQDLSPLPGGAPLPTDSPLPLPMIFMPLPASIARQSELPVQLAAEPGIGLAGVSSAPDVVAGLDNQRPGARAAAMGNPGRVAEFAVDGKMLPQSRVEQNADSPNLPFLSAESRPMPEIQANGLPVMLAASHAAEARPVAASPATLHAPVGTAGWGEALGQKVVWMAGQQTQVAELHLNPPHLGPMEVRLSISNDQISALFVSHQPAVREALEAAMPRLREMFADNGMTLGNATVGSDSLPQQPPSGHEGQPGSSRTPAFSAMGGMLSSPDREGMISLRHDGSGMVDLFA